MPNATLKNLSSSENSYHAILSTIQLQLNAYPVIAQMPEYRPSTFLNYHHGFKFYEPQYVKIFYMNCCI